MKFVFKDGADSPATLINGYQVVDSASEQGPGMRGDFLFAKDINRLYLHQGNHHSYIYHSEDPPPAIPATLPPSPLSVKFMVDAYWNLSDADDVIVMYNPSYPTVLTMHDANTAKVKPYHIKCWSANNVHIRTIAGNFMEAPELTEIILAAPGTITLVPLTGHPYWTIL